MPYRAQPSWAVPCHSSVSSVAGNKIRHADGNGKHWCVAKTDQPGQYRVKQVVYRWGICSGQKWQQKSNLITSAWWSPRDCKTLCSLLWALWQENDKKLVSHHTHVAAWNWICDQNHLWSCCTLFKSESWCLTVKPAAQHMFLKDTQPGFIHHTGHCKRGTPECKYNIFLCKTGIVLTCCFCW